MPDRTVDPIYVPLTVTTPAGTLATSPLFTPAGTPLGKLISVEVLIPPGHAGQTGIRIELAQQQIVPFSRAASWLIGDDIDRSFETDVQIDQTVRCASFNIGQYNHSHYLLFKVARLTVLPAALALIPNSALGATG